MEAVTDATLQQVSHRFDALRDVAGFGAIRTEDEYAHAMALVDAILETTRNRAVREDRSYSLNVLLDLISPAIRDYEAKHFPMPAVSPREVLRFLMEQHNLTQSDLPEVGNQSVVSQVLSGTRMLNARQIAGLSARFGLSADAFLEAVTLD